MTMASAENSSSSITFSVTLQPAPLSDERVRIKTLRDAERDRQILGAVKTDAYLPLFMSNYLFTPRAQNEWRSR